MGPDRDDATTVIISPPPTPNGPLHVGHLAGPYLAADVAARAARRSGEDVLTVCGLDDHQNYVLARAVKDGADPGQLRAHHAAMIRAVFGRIGIAHDEFVEPAQDPLYRAAVVRFMGELVHNGALPVEQWEAPRCPNCPGTLHHAYVSGLCGTCGSVSGGGTCEGCGGYTPATELVDPTCTRCGCAATEVATVRGPVLRLEDHRDALLRAWSQASLPPTVREMIGRLLSRGLPTIPVTYPTDWGIETPAFAGHRLDVWLEMGFGYLYSVGRRFAPYAVSLSDHLAGWRSVKELWTFLGLDNAFYYAVMFPALFAAAGLPEDVLGGLVVNEFYTLDGSKFSTSRNHAVWAHEFLAREHPATVRSFLCWDRPSPYQTDFSHAHYRDVVARLAAGPAAPVGDPADLARARHALALRHFDPALAMRCLLAGEHGEAGADLLGAISGAAQGVRLGA